jgi:hypothetical protein
MLRYLSIFCLCAFIFSNKLWASELKVLKNGNLKLGSKVYGRKWWPKKLKTGHIFAINEKANKHYQSSVRAYRLYDSLKVLSIWGTLGLLLFETQFASGKQTNYWAYFLLATGLPSYYYKKKSKKEINKAYYFFNLNILNDTKEKRAFRSSRDSKLKVSWNYQF